MTGQLKEDPFVIWYNDNEDMYYFVKEASASKKGTTSDKLPTEILIPAFFLKGSNSTPLELVLLIVSKKQI
ncbi:hypothetical protein [Mesomycoplasma ovipneumoniae]|uniref:hypothetical protein n=1 Tax=Mesomycoplasma ovipneumoniae TaxID=29562 RepID=UPI00207972D6|nr:hypothetical protein [Mesomycoplasma ovipneumoniae]MCN0157806.1 hypothetical protein [Mesomycoplasma ovipneumoniae]MDO6856313.1 hypothetical protein [Mesomycoplasma ovipneumoniae]